MKSLLPHHSAPLGRTPPDDLVARLREINPEAELLYIGKGKWLLGLVRPDGFRRRMALARIAKLTKILERAYLLPEEVKRAAALRLWKARLHAEGFKDIALYQTGDPDGSIVEDLREREWTFRHRWKETVRERNREIDGTAAEEATEARIRDYIRSEGPSIHRTAFRHRRMIGTH